MAKVDFRKGGLTGAASILALALATGTAFAQGINFNIDAQPLDKALLDFNAQSGVTVAAPRELVDGKSSAPVRGEMEPADALDVLLADSGLHATRLSSGAYTVTLRSASLGEATTSEPFRMAQVDERETIREVRVPEERSNDVDEDVIVVTGTNIRGQSTQPSPVFVFDRADIDAAGIVSTQELLRVIPQNLASEGGVLGGAGEVISGGTSVNLRGLGSASTLILVNGRRISPGSNTQRVDVSLIPLSAVKRVEILADGASAIYGSDAIAGVINFILNDDFDGAETRLRFGAVTDGGLQEYQASQAIGHAWETGSIFANYEFYRRDELTTGERSFSSEVPEPSDLLPETERHSLYLTGRQSLSETVELFGDFTFSDSRTDTVQSQQLGAQVQTNSTDTASTQLGGTVGLNVDLPNDWQGQVYGAYSENEIKNDIFNDGALDSDGAFDTSIWMLEGRIDGPLFTMPGGEAKFALGGQFRNEQFESDIVFRGNPSGIDVDRDITAAFGEVFLPLIGDENALPLVQALELTAAVRYEDYSDFGSSTNPKLGVRLAPSDGLSFRGSYGTSFRAPEFQQLNNPMLVVAVPGFIFLPPPGETSAPSLIQIGGGNPDLGPEESETWTLGLDYLVNGPLNFDFSVTYFDISFTDRISDPLNGSILAVFADPDVLGSSLNTNPSANEIADLFAADMFFNFFGVQPTEVGAIANQNLQNIAATNQEGIDWSASVQTEVGWGRLNAGISGNYIIDFTDQLTPTTNPIDVVDTLGNPVDLRLRANLGLASDGLSTNVYLNYIDSFTSRATGVEQNVSSWTTVDLNMSWTLDHYLEATLFEKATFGLIVQNLFDQDPPFVDRAGGGAVPAFFDGVNATPLGRFLAVQLKKQF